MSSIKNYVLDTSVLVHDPRSIFNFEDNNVWVPVDTLEDLDGFKSEQTDRGAHAREFIRTLSGLFINSSDMANGVKTAGGGRIFVARAFQNPNLNGELDQFKRQFPDIDKIDNRIIFEALHVQKSNQPRTILVTKDINMALKARSAGLETNDYLNDKVVDPDIQDGAPDEIDVSIHEMQRFASSGILEVDASRMHGVGANEYVLFRSANDKTIPARCSGGSRFQKLNFPPVVHIQNGISLKPLNLGQQCFFDALFDPDITFVTGYGHAGTGKTLLAVAAGLAQVINGNYHKLIVTRSIVPMGESLGFLPGDLNEKMHPWLQPIYDALEFLLTPAPSFDSKKKGKKKREFAPPSPSHQGGKGFLKPYERLMEQGILDIEALSHIRGRSIPNSFFIVDEAQQLTPLAAKTIVTRMSKGSKLVMLGDPAQIDNHYVDAHSNGLVYARNKLKGHGVTAHVSLTKGERSPLANLAAELM
ncbi:MAG: PhoH family protein [Verrucomicrobiota bacterium]|nr:PhoH family protein [Verrucomicrobiota bacterium]